MDSRYTDPGPGQPAGSPPAWSDRSRGSDKAAPPKELRLPGGHIWGQMGDPEEDTSFKDNWDEQVC